MRRLPVLLVVVLLLLIGMTVFLSTQAREVPTGPIETEVSRSANAA